MEFSKIAWFGSDFLKWPSFRILGCILCERITEFFFFFFTMIISSEHACTIFKAFRISLFISLHGSWNKYWIKSFSPILAPIKMKKWQCHRATLISFATNFLHPHVASMDVDSAAWYHSTGSSYSTNRLNMRTTWPLSRSQKGNQQKKKKKKGY